MKTEIFVHYEIYINYINPTYTTRPYKTPDFLLMHMPKRVDDMFELETVDGEYIFLMADKLESIKCKPITEEQTK